HHRVDPGVDRKPQRRQRHGIGPGRGDRGAAPRPAPAEACDQDRDRRVEQQRHLDRTTGEATVAFEPSLVKVTLADDIAAVLPPGVPNPLTVTPGQTVCLPLPDPLQSCITVGNGSQSKLADGTTHAEAAAVSLQLLTGLPGGGVQASLARTVVEGLVVAQEGTRAETATPDKVAANTGGTTNAALLG